MQLDVSLVRGRAMRNFVLISALVAGLPFAHQAGAQVPNELLPNDLQERCEDLVPETRIEACSALIERGSLPNETLASVYNNRGTGFYAIRDLERAIQDFTQAIRLNPNSAEAFLKRARTYRDMKNYGRTIQDLDVVLQFTPKDAEILVMRGDAKRFSGDNEGSIPDYDLAIKIDPKNATAFFDRGVAYSNLNDHDRAIEDYTQNLRLNPDAIGALYNHGIAYSEKGDSRRAIQDYDRTIQLNPNHDRAFYSRGISYRALGDVDRAIQDYDRAIQLNPRDIDSYFSRGFAKFLAGRFAETAEDFARVIEAGADNKIYAALWQYMNLRKGGETRTDELARQTASFVGNKWPGPVIRFYLVQTTAQELRKAAQGGNAETQRNQVCEANFFIAEYKLWNGNPNAAKPLLQDAAMNCPPDFLECDAALVELRRMP